jgi:hypothetical protein
MSDYYTELKKKVDVALSKPLERIAELRKQISSAEKQLQNEIDKSENIKQRLIKLKSIAGEKISDSPSSYEKFKVSLKKLHNENEVSGEIIIALRDEFIPKLKDKLREACSDKLWALNQIARDGRCVGLKATADIAQAVLRLLDILVAEHKSFQSAWMRIYADFGYGDSEDYFRGIGYGEGHPDIMPLGLSKEDFAALRKLFSAKTTEPVQDNKASVETANAG